MEYPCKKEDYAIVSDSILLLVVLFIITWSTSAFSLPYPDVVMQEDACKFISDSTDSNSQTVLSDFIQEQGWLNVNNDGEIKEVRFKEEGSAHNTSFDILEKNGNIRSADSLIFKNTDKDDFYSMNSKFSWFSYKGYTFLLTLEKTTFKNFNKEIQLPEALWYIDKDYSVSKICGFINQRVASNVKPTSNIVPQVEELCKQAGEHRINSYLSPLGTQKESVSFDKGAVAYFYILADINNDGKEEKLYQVEHSSGSGAGCDSNYYIIDSDREYFLNKDYLNNNIPKKNLFLSKLSSEFYSTQGFLHACTSGIEFKLFKFNGYIFLEIEGHNANRPMEHQVWIFLKDNKINLCNFEYTISTKYKLLGFN